MDKIAVRDYQPTDDEIIRARLRTLGVQEYRFIFEHGWSSRCLISSVIRILTSLDQGRSVGQEWRLYDVGGARSSVSLTHRVIS